MDTNFATLSLQTLVLATHITEADAAYLRACGLSIRVSIIWGLMPGPLSPSLILYLLSENMPVEAALNRATSRDFLAAVQPAVETRLRAWPPPKITRDGKSVLDLDVRRDPWTLIASCAIFDGTQVCFHFHFS